MPGPEIDRILTKRTVVALTSLSATTIWRLVQKSDFPPPSRISPGRVGWSERAVREWMAQRTSIGGLMLDHEASWAIRS